MNLIYIRETQTAKVVFTPNANVSFKFNDIGNLVQYEKVIWNKELAYLYEYAVNMTSPEAKPLVEIYKHNPNLIYSYFSSYWAGRYNILNFL